MIRVLFFGRLAELAGARELAAPGDIASLSALRAWLRERDPHLADALVQPGVKFAVNGAFTHADAPLRPGDEAALMPPLSGG